MAKWNQNDQKRLIKTRGCKDYDPTQIKSSVHACCETNEKRIFRKHYLVQLSRLLLMTMSIISF